MMEHAGPVPPRSVPADCFTKFAWASGFAKLFSFAGAQAGMVRSGLKLLAADAVLMIVVLCS